MKCFVIGKYRGPHRKCEAYKIYITESKKSALVSKEEIIELLKKDDIKIIGLRTQELLYYTEQGIQCGEYITELTGTFNTKKVDIVNEYGHTDNPKTYIVIGIDNFGKLRKYLCIDANGEEHILNHDEMIERIEAGGIVGASQSHEGIILYRACSKHYKLN